MRALSSVDFPLSPGLCFQKGGLHQPSFSSPVTALNCIHEVRLNEEVAASPYFCQSMSNERSQTEDRKKDHIDLAFEAQLQASALDSRFYYEPLFSSHPKETDTPWGELKIAGKSLRLPLWVSSMTGGTTHARTINAHLAQGCDKFGMGMGLGSCRILLDEEKHYGDFQVRPLIGAEQPLFANLGIAQLEEIIRMGSWHRVEEMIDRLEADGLIIHVNPMQEWFQPEGDRFAVSSLETIQAVLELTNQPIIVKEVGQGMGPKSLEALLKLPLAALDFGAGGGTNFSLLEALRGDEEKKESWMPLAQVGHSAIEMATMINGIIRNLGNKRLCPLLIVSGGIQSFLDGYYCMEKIEMPAIYGQASALLKRSMEDVEQLYRYLDFQRQGLQMAYRFLHVK